VARVLRTVCFARAPFPCFFVSIADKGVTLTATRLTGDGSQLAVILGRMTLRLLALLAPSPRFFVSIADKGVSVPERAFALAWDGSVGLAERVGLSVPTGSGQATRTGFAEEEGIPHAGCFL
jgi:hypothetical protein